MHTKLNKTFLIALTPILLSLATLSIHADEVKSDQASSHVDVESKKLIPVSHFFRGTQLQSVTASPDGKHVGLLIAAENGSRSLVVLDTNSLQSVFVRRYQDHHIEKFHWVNANRIVFEVEPKRREDSEVRSGGVLAIDIDGSNERFLINSGRVGYNLNRVLDGSYKFHSVKRSFDSPEIYVTQTVSQGKKRNPIHNLFRLNTLTGQLQSESRPCETNTWLTDFEGKVRIVTCSKDGVKSTHYKNNDNEWIKLFSSKVFENNGIEAHQIGRNGELYVTALIDNDTRALFKYDVQKLALAKEPLVNVKGYDFSGFLIQDLDDGSLLGVRYESDLPGVVWLHPGYKTLQEKIDERLPNLVNNLTPIKNSKRFLVSSFSDVEPNVRYIYDSESDKLFELGRQRPWINSKEMSLVDPIKVTARDGAIIPGYITLPRGKSKNLPMVVLIHGGPFLRGEHWRWEPQAQFLASRGYAVLQMDFRGSTGYGLKHESAGWKQWGMRMQDDVTDATRWAIEKGYADPKRICLAGASYGGYATLWGLIKEPDLYRCGVSWVGPTDLTHRYTMTWNDTTEETEEYYLRTKVGDIDKDREQMDAHSPLQHAMRLKQPLILAYGGLDKRVPIANGTRFYSAIQPYNDKVEWIEYPDEGHGWFKLKNQVDFWQRVEKFLNENIP